MPKTDPSDKSMGATIDRLRTDLPQGALVGGPVAENHDLEQTLKDKTPLVIGVVLALGFLAWLLIGGRRRDGEKYAGLRILR